MIWDVVAIRTAGKSGSVPVRLPSPQLSENTNKPKAITMTDEKRIQNLVAAVADLEPDIDQEFLTKAAAYCGGEIYLREMIRVLRDVKSMKKG